MRLFQLIPLPVLLLFVTEAVLVLSVFLTLAMIFTVVDFETWLLYGGGWIRFVLISASLLFGFYLTDLYSKIRAQTKYLIFQKVCVVFGFAFLLQAMASYLAPALVLPRWVMMSGSVFLIVFLPFWRSVVSQSARSAAGGVRVLLIGVTPAALRFVGDIQARPEMDLRFSGYMAGRPAPELDPIPWLGTFADLDPVLESASAQHIIVAAPDALTNAQQSRLVRLRHEGLSIETIWKAYEHKLGRICMDGLQPRDILPAGRLLSPRANYIALQRVYSTLFGLISLITLAPVMMIIAVFLRVRSSGPVLRRQPKLGYQRRAYSELSFNSEPESANAGRESFLRRTHLDRLPCLINLVRGDMALIGPEAPRPEMAEILSRRLPLYTRRHLVRPGIMGWAQINSGSREAAELIEFDLFYVCNMGFTLDLYIVAVSLKRLFQ